MKIANYLNLNEKKRIIYIYKVIISVRLFVCPILTQEPLDRFAAHLDWGTRKIHGNALSLILNWVDPLLIYDKERVNGGTNNDVTVGSQASIIQENVLTTPETGILSLKVSQSFLQIIPP